MTIGLALFSVAFSASAQLNTYNVVFDGVTHSGGPMGGVDTLTPTGPTGLSADFSSSRLLQINFLAPEGQQFVYNPASPGTYMSLILGIGSGPNTFGSVLNAGFLGDNGEASTEIVGQTWAVTPGGLSLGINVSAPKGFSFTGYSVTVEAPVGDSDLFVNVTPDVLTFEFQTMFGDFGQQVTMEPVPEPSTTALAGLVGLGLLLLAQRRK